MRNPKELKVFSLADQLVTAVYELTATFPAAERYGLTQQIRRATVSIASNIVEGCSRESKADFRRFIEIATGSAMEAEYQLSLACRFGFGDRDRALDVQLQASAVAKALIGFSKTLRADG